MHTDSHSYTRTHKRIHNDMHMLTHTHHELFRLWVPNSTHLFNWLVSEMKTIDLPGVEASFSMCESHPSKKNCKVLQASWEITGHGKQMFRRNEVAKCTAP